MIIPKSMRRKPPQMKDTYAPAHIDVWAEQFGEDVECHLYCSLESDDPGEIRKLAAYLLKAAEYFEYLRKRRGP